LGDEYAANAEAMTAADRVSAFASILTRAATDKPPGAGLHGIENNQDSIIYDVFPLHDPRYAAAPAMDVVYYHDGHHHDHYHRLRGLPIVHDRWMLNFCHVPSDI
jgi:hypothetical protein